MENHCIIYPSWPVHGFEARQSAALSFSPDIYSARQSGPINFPDYIEPIVTRPTSTARWIYPQGCSSSSSTSPPLFKFNFSAECIESTLPPERHLVSFSFSSFSSFLESLSPHLLREEIFVFFLFFFRMLEKKFFCFEFHYSKRYRRARDLPRVFKKTVTSRWAPPSRSESKSIEFERFRSKTCSTQIKSRELFIIHWWEPRPARLNDPSHRKHDEISNSFFINRETQFPSFRSKDSGCAVDDSVSPWPRFFEKNEKLEIKKGILRNVFFLINSNVIRGKDSSFQNEEKEQRDSIPEILFNETKYISLIVLLTTPSIRV